MESGRYKKLQEGHMRLEAVITAVLVLSVCTPAIAESWDNTASPQFSAAEARTVARNGLLRTLLETDPWLVREILDAAADRPAKNSEECVAGALDVISWTMHPDIVSSTGTAAASAEWINLLRRARADRESKLKHDSGGRSAKASVELLEVLKQAKKEKEKLGAKLR
jgi:hypothetical protein